MPAFRSLTPLLLSALLLTSCGNYARQRSLLAKEVCGGELKKAESSVSQMIDREKGQDNSVWLRLDRAMMRFMRGDDKGAVSDFCAAIDTMDLAQQHSTLEETAKLLLDDSVQMYGGDDFEQLLARVYLSLVLLHRGDSSNAHALLRQAEEWHQIKREQYRSRPDRVNAQLVDNALAKYLLALFSERDFDHHNSAVLFAQAEKIVGHALPRPDFEQQAAVLVLIHNGTLPLKHSETVPASVASMAALEVFLGAIKTPPALASLPGIELPYYGPAEKLGYIPTEFDGQSTYPICLTDVAKTAREELESQKPLLAAKAVARVLLRRAMVYSAQRSSDLAGSLADLTFLIANCATRADTRSWQLLPSRIDGVLLAASPGAHTLKIADRELTLCLQRGEIYIVHLFRPSEKQQILVLPKNLQNQENL